MDLIVEFPQERPPQRVTIADRVKVKFIENLSNKHKADLWFTRRELEFIRSGMIQNVRSIISSGVSFGQYAEMNVHNTSAFLGLEMWLSPNTSRNIRDQRDAIWRAVLAEQQRQLVMDIHDPEAMAFVAESVSEKSRKRARIIGLLHAPQTKDIG